MIYTVYSVPNCEFCEKAISLIARNNYGVAIRAARDLTAKEWKEKIGFVPKTAPQILLGSEYVGNYDGLVKHFADKAKL